MRVVERAHHIDITVDSGADQVIPYLRQKWPELQVLDDEEMVRAEDSAMYQKGMALLENSTPGERLRLHRTRTGMSQKKLGEVCGVARSNISLMEKGKRQIGLGVAKKLASALGVSYKDLL